MEAISVSVTPLSLPDRSCVSVQRLQHSKAACVELLLHSVTISVPFQRLFQIQPRNAAFCFRPTEDPTFGSSHQRLSKVSLHLCRLCRLRPSKNVFTGLKHSYSAWSSAKRIIYLSVHPYIHYHILLKVHRLSQGEG